jgi:chitodextrinase
VSTGGDTQAPTVPGNLHPTGNTDTTVALAWTASTDNRAVTGYLVFNGASQVGTTGSTNFTVSGLSPSTTYTFTVKAQDAAGNTSAASNSVSVTTSANTSTNLALHKPTSESSHTQVYGSGNAVDGDANTYWESANSAFPQWLQVDLSGTTATKRIVLTLPPSSSWGTRTQTIGVSGSTDGGTFTTIVGAAGYTFNPATGNTATITFPSTVNTRYLRLTFTGNTGWPAGQVSEFRVFSA